MVIQSKTLRSPQRLLNLLGFGTAVSLLGDATLYTVLPNPPIANEVGVTLAIVGVLLGVNRGVRILLNGPVGSLYDRLPRRRLLIGSLVMGTCSSVIYAVGTGFWPLFIGRVLWGMAWSLLWIGGNAVVLDVSTDATRGRNSGQYQMWFFIGVGSASLLGGVFTDLFGFRGGLWLSASLIGVASLIWLFFLPETRPDQVQRHQANHQLAKIQPFPWKPVLWASLPMFVNRFVGAGVIAATGILWLGSFVGEQVQVLRIAIPLATLTGLFRAVIMLMSVAGAPAAGLVSDRLGRRWPVVTAIVLLGGVGAWLMSVDWFALALIGALLPQLTGGGVGSLVPAIAGDQTREPLQGRALGVIYTVGDLASMLGPPIALGLLNSGAVTLDLIFQGCAVFYFVVGLATLTQIRSEPKFIWEK